MLTDDEQREIETEMTRYADKRAACIDALKIVQRHRRWVSDESIVDIARFLDMTAAELDSVATFYNQIFRQPVGRHVILLCDSVSCWIMGYEEIRRHLLSYLGIGFRQTTEDGRFTLLPVQCLGACDLAPVMMVDDDLHGNLTAGGIGGILEGYV